MNEHNAPQTIVETASYLKAVTEIWDDETQRDFKNFIALHPTDGSIIPGTGGIRKIRWQSSGHGKRGGARVIYYVYNERHPIYLLFAYPKNVKDDLSEKEKRTLALAAGILKAEMMRKEARNE